MVARGAGHRQPSARRRNELSVPATHMISPSVLDQIPDDVRDVSVVAVFHHRLHPPGQAGRPGRIGWLLAASGLAGAVMRRGRLRACREGALRDRSAGRAGGSALDAGCCRRGHRGAGARVGIGFGHGNFLSKSLDALPGLAPRFERYVRISNRPSAPTVEKIRKMRSVYSLGRASEIRPSDGYCRRNSRLSETGDESQSP